VIMTLGFVLINVVFSFMIPVVCVAVLVCMFELAHEILLAANGLRGRLQHTDTAFLRNHVCGIQHHFSPTLESEIAPPVLIHPDS